MTISTPEGTGQSAPLALEEQAPTRRRLADSQPTTTAARLKDSLYYLRGRGALEISAVYLAILLGFIITALVNPAGFAFVNSNNLSGVLSQNIPVLAILAIGAGVLMIAGEFDLSIGATIGLCGVVFIRTANSAGWPVAFVATVAVGIAVMLINGAIVVSIYVNGSTPATFFPGVRTDTMVNLMAGNYGYFRSQLVWLVLVGVASWFFLHRHRAGNKLYAVGGNAAAAAAVSIKPKAVRLQAFAFLGLMVGIASSLYVARTSGMQPGTTESYTLLAIAAAVVGGCSLTGGRGSVTGMVVGSALILTIENGLVLGNAPGFYVQLFLGVAIVIAAVFNKFMEGKAT